MLETSSATAAAASGERPIRVAYVMHVMQFAGAEMLVAETIRLLGPRIAPVVVCLDAVGALGEQLIAEGVPVIALGRRPGRDWGVALRLAREVRQRGIDIIHAHQYTPFFYSALARVVAYGRPRLIFTEHGRHYPDIVGRNRRTLNRALLQHLASDVNAVCGFSARALETVDGFSAVPISVIENGIRPERYRHSADRPAAKRAAGLDPGRRYVACVARFHPVKDHRTLIDAFREVAPAFPDVDLLLVGDGELRPALTAQVAGYGLDTRVRFLGVRQDVPALLAAADLFSLTSVSEAASLTLLEAMASDLPVVVTDVGGNPEIVRNGVDGLLAPRANARAIAAGIARLLRDDDLSRALGRSGAERVHSIYRLDRTIARYGALYTRLVRPHAAAGDVQNCAST